MADTVEPQNDGGVATDGKEKTAEESTTATEAPESEQGNNVDKSDAGGEGKSETEAGAAKTDSANGDEKEANDTKEKAEGGGDEEKKGVAPVVSSSKRTRPPYKYDPEKITLRFLFANRDGLTVTVECTPSDTVGEVKGALLSVWPEDLPSCSGGDRIRLICMGKGILMPDTRTLEDCQVPVFKTHPTPINVSVRPETNHAETSKSGGDSKGRNASAPGGSSGGGNDQTSQGCACVIL